MKESNQNKKIYKLNDNEADSYIALNAKAKLFLANENNLKLDLEAAREYLKEHVTPRYKRFSSVKERFDYLVDNHYYEEEIVRLYTQEQLDEIYQEALDFQHFFPSFMGALKFYNAYALKTFDGLQYLEHYHDRALMNALFLAGGNFIKAKEILRQIMLGRFQPATPTFLNAGRKQRGEYISCYLLRVEDNMESIGRAVTTSLQLSKRGGGVALCLTNLREFGAPIKKIAGQATGIVPVMKILEDSFSYANQLGQRQGAGAVYLHAHHPEIMTFLDTKRENADEKIRIKSLSLGVIIPDITFELAKNDDKMALFSPYDVEKEYGVPLSDISVTKEYYNLINNPKITKTYIKARKFFQMIAELHFESGYPYLLFDDTVNRANALPGRVVMSNLCSEIVQVSKPSEYSTDLSFTKVGQDIACNLGSINIDKAMESGHEFSDMIHQAISSLDMVSRTSDISSAPSIQKGNDANHAVGLGAMNLHGFLAVNHIYYNSPEAVDFTNMFFYTVAYHAYKASNRLAKKYGTFQDFNKSKLATGEYFDKYTKSAPDFWTPKTSVVKELFEKYEVQIPTQEQWIKLVEQIKDTGLANSHLMAIAPTGSISYLSSCTPSLQPVVAPVEVRKEGMLGRVYVPAYKMNWNNMKYYREGAYEIGPEAIINIAAAAQQHVDQAISLTLFMKDTATTRDLNKAYIHAFKKGCKSVYYVRIRQDVLEDSEKYDECESCVI